jgi:hypothetical protein
MNTQTVEELENLVTEWGYDKGILPNAPRMKQADKSQEELDELIEAIEKDDYDEAKDAIGDIIVTLIMQINLWQEEANAREEVLNLATCLDAAYGIISKRTGNMVDGQFVKDQ